MDIYDELFFVLIALQFVAAIVFLLWQKRLMPRALEKKYPYLTRLQCAMPFPSQWERKIEASDLVAFRNYRKAAVFFDGFLVVTVGLELFIWLWRSA